MKLICLKCTNCGAEIELEPDSRQAYCQYCGSKLMLDDEPVQVTSRIVDEARIKEAEVRMKELEYAHEREMRELAMREEQQKARTATQYETSFSAWEQDWDSPKSRVAALVLCICLGMFGAHYFYVNKVKTGLLYLCTCGIFGAGWIIDIFRIGFGAFTDSDGHYLK